MFFGILARHRHERPSVGITAQDRLFKVTHVGESATGRERPPITEDDIRYVCGRSLRLSDAWLLFKCSDVRCCAVARGGQLDDTGA